MHSALIPIVGRAHLICDRAPNFVLFIVGYTDYTECSDAIVSLYICMMASLKPCSQLCS